MANEELFNNIGPNDELYAPRTEMEEAYNASSETPIIENAVKKYIDLLKSMLRHESERAGTKLFQNEFERLKILNIYNNTSLVKNAIESLERPDNLMAHDLSSDQAGSSNPFGCARNTISNE